MDNQKLLKKQADTIRFLCADMVQQANSGHPGAPMGLADIVTVLALSTPRISSLLFLITTSVAITPC